MKLTAQFDYDDIKYFNESIDKLFKDIRTEVSSAPAYTAALQKVRRGMHENKLALKNSDGWAKVKAKLAKDNKIPYDDPLNVTGQLVEDFYAKVLSTRPSDLVNIGVELTFKDIPRIRPTMKSMYNAYRDDSVDLEYEMKSSYAIAAKLERYTGTINGVNYNISEAIYKLYADDFEKIVYAQVQKAFNANK